MTIETLVTKHVGNWNFGHGKNGGDQKRWQPKKVAIENVGEQ